MTCREVRELLPLYLSGEMADESFETHLRNCEACSSLISQQRAADFRLRSVVLNDSQQATAVQQRIRLQIRSVHRPAKKIVRWFSVAAMVAFASAGALWLAAPPRAFADAARDHKVEVIQNQPRRWRTGPELSALVQHYGLSEARIAQLAPAGYWLQHGKNCGIEGQRALHLVYTDGTRAISLFLKPDTESSSGVRNRKIGEENLVGFHTSHFAAIVVGDAPEADCLKFSQGSVKTL